MDAAKRVMEREGGVTKRYMYKHVIRFMKYCICMCMHKQLFLECLRACVEVLSIWRLSMWRLSTQIRPSFYKYGKHLGYRYTPTALVWFVRPLSLASLPWGMSTGFLRWKIEKKWSVITTQLAWLSVTLAHICTLNTPHHNAHPPLSSFGTTIIFLHMQPRSMLFRVRH